MENTMTLLEKGIELEKPRMEEKIKDALALADYSIKRFEKGVLSNEDNEQAGTSLKDIRAKTKELNEDRLERTRPYDTVKKMIMDLFRIPDERLKLADATISGAMAKFWQEQERARAAEEARLKAIADKEAAKLIVRAEKAEASGKDDKAEGLRLQAQDVQATVPMVESKVAKVTGLGMRTYYYAKVIDEAKVRVTHQEFFSLDQVKLNKYADAMKGSTKIDGIRFWSEVKPIRT